MSRYVSLDVKILINKIERHSSVVSGMNALKGILTVTDDDSDSELSADNASSPSVICDKNVTNKMIVESAGEFTDEHMIIYTNCLVSHT